MNPIERATVLHYHRHRLAAHGGEAPEALGWRHAESQRLRFQVIAQAADFNGCSVLDLGCGTGDLKAFLDERFSGLRYLGIDQQPEFIEAARARFAAQPDTAFALAHFDTAPLPPADVVVASGALGYRCADPHWIFNVVARMVAAAEQVLVFNLLDAAVFPAHPLLVGHDVDEVAAFCRKLALRVDVVRGYLEDDATLAVRRRPVRMQSAE
jgi:trans-aconitate methyltransferase